MDTSDLEVYLRKVADKQKAIDDDAIHAIMEENCLRIAVKTKELLLEKAAERFREELQQVVSLMNYASPGSGNIIEIEKSVDHFIKKIEDRI